MRKHCLECREPITGRTDKKFCSDDCRSRHHHKKRSKSIPLIRNINFILKRNRSILEKHTRSGRRSIRISRLIELGFSFEYYTHERETRSGKKYRFCYDQGYAIKDHMTVYLKTDRYT